MAKDFTLNSFWSKVNKTETCWLWTGGTNGTGYGRISRYGLRELCHRVSWMLTYGNIPKNKLVLHKCDVRLCVNPEHLFLGNEADNALDMVNKGRSFHPNREGELSKVAILSEHEVKQIRALNGFLDRKIIASIFNINQSHVSSIIKRRKWKHLWTSAEEYELIRNQWASQYT